MAWGGQVLNSPFATTHYSYLICCVPSSRSRVNHAHPVVTIFARQAVALSAIFSWLAGSRRQSSGPLAPGLGRVFTYVAVLRFEMMDATEHLHLPLKGTRWELALFRGA